MKITPIFLIVLLVSCKKNRDLPLQESEVTSPVITQQKPETCNFGIQVFNKNKRIPTSDTYTQRKKPKGNKSPLSIPNATILLDFDGELVTNTAWNNQGDIEATPANLLNAEVEKVVRRVSEDFAPFNVVVTTDEDLYRATKADKRIRVIITENWEWFGVVGGTAFNNSFTWGNGTPCFIFSTLLGYNEKFVAEAISHEVGHTLGLLHQSAYEQCTFISEYNEGFGQGITSWAPIMGIGYYKNVTTWHKGPTVEGCNTIQDDVAVITSVLGKKDDDNAEMNKSQRFNEIAGGIMNTSSDIDYYYIDVKETGTLRAEPTCLGDGEGANMNLKLTLFDKNGDVMRSVNGTATLSASIVLDPDKYYIGVETEANENQSRYGMLGTYTLRLN